MKRFTLCVVLILLFTVAGLAQSKKPVKKTTQTKSEVTDIRRVDFLNFTYQSSLCSQDIRGISKTVKVRKGNFDNNEVYYGVVENKIIYGDVTGDGREEAIVHIGCGELAANFGLSEIFIYTLQNGRVILLAELDDKDMERDYNRYHSNGTLWRIVDDGVRVINALLIIERFSEGSHASPEYIVTLNYRLNGTRLALSGKPNRKKLSN